MVPDVTIIIVNYRTVAYTIQCIESILNNPPDCSHAVVVVDNASGDGSGEQLAARFPTLHHIQTSSNLGFAGANNVAVRQSAGRYVLLVNSDTLVTPGTVDRVVAFADAHPDAGAVGGNLVHGDGSFQASHIGFPSLWQEFLVFSQLGMRLLFRNYPSAPPVTTVTEVDWMSGAFLLLRRAALEQVGLMDESYFMYSEESDLQYRLKQAGWKRYCLPDVQTVHFGGKSSTSGQRRLLIYRGYLMFFAKHYGRGRQVALRAMLAWLVSLRLVAMSVLRLVPRAGARSARDMQSYRDILRLCLQADLSGGPI